MLALAGQTLELSYTAKVNASVQATEITNDGTLTYGNGGELETNTDDETIRTYDKTFVKVDDGLWGSCTLQEPISGAKFLVRQDATQSPNSYLRVAEDGTYAWIDLTDEAAKADALGENTNNLVVLTSDANGEVFIEGLRRGNYDLVEIEAPAGFQLPSGDDAVTRFAVTGEPEEPQEYTRVVNYRKPDMPMTGSEQVVLVVGGLAL